MSIAMHELEREMGFSTGTSSRHAGTLPAPYGLATSNRLRSWALEGEEGGATTPCQITTVTAWINAFIPGFIPGLTRVVGPSGQTALTPPVPGLDCFLTDQRTFSPLLSVSSRMHSRVTFDLSTPSAPPVDHHSIGMTHGVDCASGALTCRQTAGKSGMRFFNFRSLAAGQLLTLELTAAAANPCIFGAPDIDYRGTLTVDCRADPTRRIALFSFDGLVDGFPAFEMYVSVNGGVALPVFLVPPTTPFGLIGPAKRRVRSLVPLVCPSVALPAPPAAAPPSPGLPPAASIARPVLRLGSKGPSVVVLQQRLNVLRLSIPAFGSTALVVDGIFGSKTGVAVRAFQGSRNLVVDGIVGPKTWAALDAAESEAAREAEFETELALAAESLARGRMEHAEQFFGLLGSPLTWAARRFWAYWSNQLDIAKRALSQQRYGCYCGLGSVCSTSKDSLDRCCQAHDGAYSAVGVGGPGGVDMWTLEGLKRTVAADEVLVRCSTAAINDGTRYGPAERLYQRGIVSIFGTRASAGRAAIRLGL